MGLILSIKEYIVKLIYPDKQVYIYPTLGERKNIANIRILNTNNRISPCNTNSHKKYDDTKEDKKYEMIAKDWLS